jgi:tetratricopeptide (TPR) repeat protein
MFGYVFRGQQAVPAPAYAAAAPATSAPVSAGPSGLDMSQVQSYQTILARDPKAVGAAVQLGNLYYDAKQYAAAVPYYQQALALKPDINVSTDLGTALYYSGRADEALTQYARSLSIVPDHAQTLFNIGIVKSETMNDYMGAMQAWERLKAKNPTYPDMARLENLLTEVRQKAQAAIVPVVSRSNSR